MEKDNTKISLSAGGNYTIFDNFIEGCQIISPDWRYLYVNDAAAGQNRSEKENLVGRSFNEVYPHIEQSELFAVLQKCMNERVAVSFENEFTFPDGHKTWFDTRVEPVPEGIFIMSIDITERKKAEESLRENEEKLRTLFETMPVGVSILDKDRNVIYENHALEKILELSKDDLLQGNYAKRKYIKSDNTEIPLNEMPSLKAFNEQKPVEDVEVGVIKEDNSIIWTNVSTIPLSFSDWKVLIITSDITELKKVGDKLKETCDNLEQKVEERTKELENAYDSLKESEEKFRLIFNAAEDSIILNEMMENGLPGKIIEANEATIKRLGYTKEELLNMTPADIIAPESLAEMPNNAGKLKREGYAIFEIAHMTKDGRRIPVEVNNHLSEFKGKKTAIAIVRDITYHKEMEKQLKETINKLKETLNELERSNDELQQFAYVSSHDLQEPLRTIASFTQLLERRYKGKLDNDADEFMGYIVDAAKRMKEQIEGLLEYSRVGTKGGEFKPVDMNDILNQTIQNLNVSIRESDAEITHEELPTVNGNARQLQRVFQNLISNAIKFRKSDEQLKVHISSYKSEDGKEYIFSVQDNGIGIEKQYLERVFAIFQQLHTREEYEGTGIGLSIVKRVIERHGGRVWVESKLGVGSTFYFTIPIKMLRSE